jgi:hypothetical protein
MIMHIIFSCIANDKEETSLRLLKIEMLVAFFLLIRGYIAVFWADIFTKFFNLILVIGIHQETNIVSSKRCYLLVGIWLLSLVLLWHPKLVYLSLNLCFLIFDSVWVICSSLHHHSTHITLLFIFGGLREIYHIFTCTSNLMIIIPIIDNIAIYYSFYNTVSIKTHVAWVSLFTTTFLSLCVHGYLANDYLMMVDHYAFLACMFAYYAEADRRGLIDLLRWCNKMNLYPYEKKIDSYTGKINERMQVTLFTAMMTQNQKVYHLADKDMHYDSVTCHFNTEKIIIQNTNEDEQKIDLFHKILANNSHTINFRYGVAHRFCLTVCHFGNIFMPDVYVLIRRLNIDNDIKMFISQIYAALVREKLAY